MTPEEIKDILAFGIRKGIGMSADGVWLSPMRDKIKMFIDQGNRYVLNPEYTEQTYQEWLKTKEGFKLEWK